MSAHVLLNLLNELGKRDKMRGLPILLHGVISLPGATSYDKLIYYILINDTSFELSVFWLSDTESRINELSFSHSVSLSFKTRPTSVSRFCGDIT